MNKKDDLIRFFYFICFPWRQSQKELPVVVVVVVAVVVVVVAVAG